GRGTGAGAWTRVEGLAARGLAAGVAGVVDDEPPADSPLRPRWLGPLERLGEIVEVAKAERIVLALEDRRGHLPLEPLLATRMRGVVVEDALEFYERVTGTMAIEAIRPGAVILSKGFRNSGAPEAVARVVSVAVAVIGLIALAPLFVLLPIAIRLESCGPILFAQDRAGKNGRPFKLLKFRTMRPCDTPRSEW